jgi:hypothetical protein
MVHQIEGIKMINIIKTVLGAILGFASLVSAQQPQAPTAPPFNVNSTYTNGVAPGYAPTPVSGLVLNIGPGTAYCNSTIVTYAGGNFTLTNSVANYIYLDTANNCAVTPSLSTFTNTQIPVAVVTPSGGNIVAENILDVRTMFNSVIGPVLQLVAGPGIVLNPPAGGGVVTISNSGTSAPLFNAITPPAGGTYITVYPTGFSAVLSGGPLGSAIGNNTSGFVTKPACNGCTGSPSIVNSVTWTFTLPSYVNAANVTAVWATANASTTYLGGNGYTATGQLQCTIGVTDYTLFTSYGVSLPLQTFTQHMTAATGSTVHSITCTAQVSAADPIQTGQTVDVPAIYLQLADSVDTAPSTATAVFVVAPLYYNPSLQTLGIDPQAQFFGTGLKVYTVAQIKAIAAPITFAIYPVRDGTGSTDCSTGGGSSHVMCYYNGSTFAAF